MAWPNTPHTTFVDDSGPPISASFLNAVQTAINGIVTGTYSFAGITVDGTGGAVVTPTGRSISITGGNGVVETTAGILTLRAAGLNDLVLSAASGQSIKAARTLLRDESTMSYTTGTMVVHKYTANGSHVGYVIHGSLQTTDATATAAYTLTMANDDIAHIVTSVVARQVGSNNCANWYFDDGIRKDAGALANVAVTADITAARDTITGTGTPSWVISGANPVLTLQGKGATTINWQFRAEVTLTNG